MEGSNVPYIIDYVEKDVINIQNVEGNTYLSVVFV